MRRSPGPARRSGAKHGEVGPSEAGQSAESGFALLVVLWTLVLLALLTAQVTSAGRVQAQTAAALRVAAQLQFAADGAVQETIWHMVDGGGDYWPPGAGTHFLKEPGASAAGVRVDIIDDRGKLDVNQVPPGLLSGLFAVLGADNATAQELGTAVADWRSQAAPGDAASSVPPEYHTDGRAWGPPGQEMERLEELRLVRGMTPALYEASLPYLTLNLEQGPWLQYAPSVVLAAIARAKRTSGIAVEAADARGPIVLHIIAQADGPGGARFVRRVMMRLDGTLSGPAWKYRIMTWE
jgi:general secretion pathway protein K